MSQDKDFLVKHYTRILNWSDEDQTYIVRVLELPGCVTHGDTIKEAWSNSDEAILGVLETLEGSGDGFPVPTAIAHKQAKFPLRLTEGLHQEVKAISEMKGISMNDLILDAIKGTVHILREEEGYGQGEKRTRKVRSLVSPYRVPKASRKSTALKKRG